jgi:hypothetical protein
MFDDREGDSDAALDRMRRKQTAIPLDDDAPYQDKLGDLIICGYVIVSDRVAEVLNRFDLGDSCLAPLDATYARDRKTPLPGDYFLFNIGEEKTAFAPENRNPDAAGTMPTASRSGPSASQRPVSTTSRSHPSPPGAPTSGSQDAACLPPRRPADAGPESRRPRLALVCETLPRDRSLTPLLFGSNIPAGGTRGVGDAAGHRVRGNARNKKRRARRPAVRRP